MKKYLLIAFVLLLSSNLYAGRWSQNFTFTDRNMSMGLAGQMAFLDSMTYVFPVYRLDWDSINHVGITEGWNYWMTTDYGATWDIIFSTERPSADYAKYKIDKAEAVQILSKDTIYLTHTLNEGETIFCKTFDRGKHWDTIRTPISRIWKDSYAKRIIYFKNANEGFLANCMDTLIYTKDGGLSWEIRTLPEYEFASYVPAELRKRAVGQYNIQDSVIMINQEQELWDIATWEKSGLYWRVIYISSDYGDTWRVIDDHVDSTIIWTEIRCRSANEFWAASTDPGSNLTRSILRKTTDSGVTWEYIDISNLGENTSFPRDIHFFDNQIILHIDSGIFRSFDEGETWKRDELQSVTGYNSWVSSRFATPTKGFVYHFFEKALYRYEDQTAVSEEYPIASNCLVYPNPLSNTDVLNIHIPIQDNMASISCQIFDLNGVQKDNYTVNSTSDDINLRYELDNTYIPGAYFLIIKSDGKIIARERFIVE